MGKKFLYLLFFILMINNNNLFASYDLDYYKIKMGSFSTKSLAKKAQKHALIPTTIVEINGFFAIVSKKIYIQRDIAEINLYKVKKRFKDAYLIKVKPKNENYRIKIASIKNQKKALIMSKGTFFKSDVIFINGYYAIVSKEIFKTRNEADRRLFDIKKIYKDAYVLDVSSLKKSNITKKSIQKPIVNKKVVTVKDNYNRGVLYFKEKKYEKALSAFDRELIENSDNKKAKIYYAKSLFMLKLNKEAIKEFETLLESNLHEKEKEEVEYYLQKIESIRKKHFFSSSISIGFGFDNNINLSPDEKYTQYGPYKLKNDTFKQKSNFALLSLIISHQYKGRYFDIYSSLSSYNELFHSANGNDLNYISLSSSIAKGIGNFSYLFGLGYDMAYLDGKKVSYNFSLSPSLIYKIDKNYSILSQISYIDNHTLFSEDRDYSLLGGGMGLRYVDKKKQLKFGFNLQNYKKKSQKRYDISKKVVQYILNGRYSIYSDLYISANLLFENHLYSDLDEVLGYEREDIKLLYTLMFTKLFGDSISIDAKYQYIDNDSNINSFAYKKNIYTLEYKYKF